MSSRCDTSICHKSLADLDNLPAPEELAQDIMENLQSAMNEFSELLNALQSK